MMKTLLIIVAIAITVWYFSAMRKIDREEEEALKTPGNAVFLRKNFGEFINKILSDSNNYIEFERSDQIRFAKKSTPDLKLIIENFRDWGGPVMIVTILDNETVLTEKKFKCGVSASEISNFILPLFS